MTWELRRILPKSFAIIFNDADTVTNRILNEYEELLFLQSNTARMVAIRKTEVHGVALIRSDSYRPTDRKPSSTIPVLIATRAAASKFRTSSENYPHFLPLR